MSWLIKMLEFQKAKVNVHWTLWRMYRLFTDIPSYLNALVMQSNALPLNPYLAPQGHCAPHVVMLCRDSRFPTTAILRKHYASVQRRWTLVRMNDLHVLLMFYLVLTTIPRSRNASALWFSHLHIWVWAVVILQRANCHRWSEWDV